MWLFSVKFKPSKQKADVSQVVCQKENELCHHILMLLLLELTQISCSMFTSFLAWIIKNKPAGSIWIINTSAATHNTDSVRNKNILLVSLFL